MYNQMHSFLYQDRACRIKTMFGGKVSSFGHTKLEALEEHSVNMAKRGLLDPWA